MANSVVKVTDAMLNDSLMLLVGEDGTVTPDRETVEKYLNSKSSPTNIQLMQINKFGKGSIDISVEDLTYVPDEVTEDVDINSKGHEMDDVARILYSFKLDHDYTTFEIPSNENDEVDDLVQTLESLDDKKEKSDDVDEIKPKPKVSPKENVPKAKVKTVQKAKLARDKPKIVQLIEEEFDEESEEEEEYNFEDDEDDSDFAIEEEVLQKKKKNQKKIRKTQSKVTPKQEAAKPQKTEPKLKAEKSKAEPEKEKSDEKVAEPNFESSKPSGPADKKVPKKEKKIPKPIPNDFMLFATPDIIRRVGKEPQTPTTPEVSPVLPAKINAENRSKSVADRKEISPKSNRLSLDGKTEKQDDKKAKERRSSSGGSATKIQPVGEKSKTESQKINRNSFSPSKNEMFKLDQSLNLPVVQTSEVSSTDALLDQAMGIDASALDLDQSILDNINSDEISEDILYQVAQSLVANPVLQTAIDKGINEGNLVLDPSLHQDLHPIGEPLPPAQPVGQTEPDVIQKAQQIVRPDGRIVVIPPIERPATRSRNRRKDPSTSKLPILKPLDDEHVSGDELDVSENEDVEDEEEEEEEDDEEESEDDPNKLWCICNQPHNNRFMICCDTCEEWYHGKCVNITKAMGQQMEEEGKEWICLFCKNPNLKRPEAAARRVRKASRASTDSAESAKKIKETSKVSCIVCQKPARKNSIYCSENCILTHAQGVERVIVYEKSSGNMLMGAKAPSSANLESWLKEHPSYQVYRSGGKIVTSKSQAQKLTQSKLQIVKNKDNHGVSLAVQNRGTKIGMLKHLPKGPQLKTNVDKIIKSPTQPKLVKLINPKPQIVKVIGRQTLDSAPKTSVAQKTPSTPKTPKLIQTSLKTSIGKEKAPTPKTPKPNKPEPVAPVVKTPKPQENIRENVQKTLYEQLLNRLKLDGTLKVPDEEVKDMSLEIESQLYKCFGDTGQKYRNKYRSLIFNIKDVKNQTLWKRICEKSVSAYQLVRLSPDDLASQELAMWREKEAKHQLDMIKKSELELLNCSRQYVLKTHKGEQVLEDNRPTDDLDNNEVIRTLTEGNQVDRDARSDGSKDSKKNPKNRHSSKERSRHRRSSSRDRKSSKDRGSSRKEKRRSRSKDRHRKSSHKTSRHKKDNLIGTTEKLDKKSKEILEQLVDNKIVPPLEDRLWKHVSQDDVVPTVESDSDHEPSSTVTIPTPPHTVETDDSQSNAKNAKEKDAELERSMSPPPKSQPPGEIWKGTINMIDVAQISITAHEVSGDCIGLGTALPPNLDIVGRISPDTVWDYIGKIKCSNSKVISLVRLNATNIEEKMPYLALYSYLSSRKRLGVVESVNKAIKDFYILPLAPQKPIPQALLPLNGPGFEESRPALLLGIIVRDKRKRPSEAPATPSVVKKIKTVENPAEALKDPVRSYTPPALVLKEPKTKISVLLPEKDDDDGDEPYSPEDSDPEVAVVAPEEVPSTSVLPFLESVTDVPSAPSYPTASFDNYTPTPTGLADVILPTLPSSSLDLQRQMEELNKKIEMQKSEIHSISKNIVSASTEIGQSALASISLPSNLQQILDSIKTISPEEAVSVAKQADQNLTIPLLLPKTFSRPSPVMPFPPQSNMDFPSIPLNLPKSKSKSVSSPNIEAPSVLSSLSEEDLVRKAAEMLGEALPPPKPKGPPSKKAKYENNEPPIPGVDN